MGPRFDALVSNLDSIYEKFLCRLILKKMVLASTEKLNVGLNLADAQARLNAAPSYGDRDCV